MLKDADALGVNFDAYNDLLHLIIVDINLFFSHSSIATVVLLAAAR